jgi:hypothetical protein
MGWPTSWTIFEPCIGACDDPQRWSSSLSELGRCERCDSCRSGAVESDRECGAAGAIPGAWGFLSVNGRPMHLYCTGHGFPTVILDAGEVMTR